MLKLYDDLNYSGNPVPVSGYVPDLQARAPGNWVARSCKYVCISATLYAVVDPHARAPADQGRTLKVKYIGRRNDLEYVPQSALTYPPGRTARPTDPPFRVRAAETSLSFF